VLSKWVQIVKLLLIHVLLLLHVQRIADTGRTVISTLQSPSIRQIAVFTRAQILKKGGETVYFGPVGTDGELIQVYISLSFSSICSSFLCKQASNQCATSSTPWSKPFCRVVTDVSSCGLGFRVWGM
jgi:hypothetical protein